MSCAYVPECTLCLWSLSPPPSSPNTPTCRYMRQPPLPYPQVSTVGVLVPGHLLGELREALAAQQNREAAAGAPLMGEDEWGGWWLSARPKWGPSRPFRPGRRQRGRP